MYPELEYIFFLSDGISNLCNSFVASQLGHYRNKDMDDELHFTVVCRFDNAMIK